ncbi:hypothetical protein F511_40152 [Dorcoceras hygrometricum]|uniref:Uncharacterized protein n=1 Tax=Dorcoceras hygrometricum TaxID=472368 RepID=A0A2Z7AUF3_9LAMI|nr:hypothetical protein F511_40152 [Dorcoceras hygrometricum]
MFYDVERSNRGACVAIRFKKIGVASLPPAIAFGKAASARSYNWYQSQGHGVFKTLPCWHLCLAPIVVTITPALHGDCGRYRQSGLRPDMRLLRHPALEGVTRSARTDSPHRIGRKQISGEEGGGGGGGGGLREERRGGA